MRTSGVARAWEPAHPAPRTAPASVAEQLDRVVAEVERLMSQASVTAVDQWPDAERRRVITSLDALGQKVAVYRGRVLLAHQRDGAWQSRGDRDFADWRGRSSGAGRGAARRELATAEVMSDHPELAGEVAAGTVSLEHARVLGDLAEKASPAIGRALSQGGMDQLRRLAPTMSAERFRGRVRRWAAGIDAVQAQQKHDEARARRSLTFRPQAGGLRLEGFFDAVAGATIRTAIEAVTGRPSADDRRTSEQRRADALTIIGERVLGDGAHKAGAQVRPHLALLVPADTWSRMRRGRGHARRESAVDQESAVDHDSTIDPAFGHLDGVAPGELLSGEVVAPSELERLMCDCAVTRMVMGADAIPLDVGREQRTYAGGLRRAILARDRHCMWPGCSMRAAWCEVHHVLPFENGGVTSADNALILCSFHHHETHRKDVQIDQVPGGVRFRTRAGEHIGTTLRDHLDEDTLTPRAPHARDPVPEPDRISIPNQDLMPHRDPPSHRDPIPNRDPAAPQELANRHEPARHREPTSHREPASHRDAMSHPAPESTTAQGTSLARDTPVAPSTLLSSACAQPAAS